MQVPRRYGCGTTVAKVGIRAPSVYGGAGGYGTRISKPYSCMDCSYDMEYCGNEKRTMQNLNGRLATYLNKVHFLEKANQKLELQIQEFYDKRSPAQKNDHTGFYATITRLSDQIYAKSVENSALMLKVDTFRLTADDFKMRLKRETKMRMNLEEDVRHLKNFKDSHTLSRKDLEIRLEELRENRTRLEKNHKEKVLFIWTQLRAAVIPVIPASRLDFNTVLEEMRAHYEAIVSKNNTETSKWYESKVTVLQSQINTTELQTLKAQKNKLSKTYQSLEIELHGLHTQKMYLKTNVNDASDRYGSKLSQQQLHINVLEKGFRLLCVSIKEQTCMYQILLNVTQMLETEIAEYKRLLDEESRPGGNAKKMIVVRKEWKVDNESITFTSNSK